MATVFKYPILYDRLDRQTSTLTLQVPVGATFLHVHAQPFYATPDGSPEETPVLWALVPDAQAPREPRTILVLGTGQHQPVTAGEYLGTAHLMEGRLVLHLFEVQAPR